VGYSVTMGVYYKPSDAWAGDFIPFHWDGKYHLFYLKDYRDEERHGRGMSWYHVTTSDFLEYEDHGEAISHGDETDQDLYAFTGCVFEKDRLFHIFYTGHNPLDNGKPDQAIMHAKSQDLVSWEKDQRFVIWADEDIYEPDDWRDPFVFWNQEAEQYWMLIAARVNKGPESRRGCIGLATSENLEDWEVRGPFWSPDLYYIHECPDLFEWDGTWYLIYSTFTERQVTHYRMSRDLSGPWTAPRNDTFDGRSFYAAKTAGNGERRFIFGWNPTKEGRIDEGAWQWGGNLVVHEVLRDESDSLSVRIPDSVRERFGDDLPLSPETKLGDWKMLDSKVVCEETDGFSLISLSETPPTCLFSTTVSWKPGTRGLGIMVRYDHESGSNYQARIEPQNSRIVYDRWPRPGDQAFMIERPLDVREGRPLRIDLILEETIVEIYADEKVALSSRAYDETQGELCLFVSEGEATFENLQLKRD